MRPFVLENVHTVGILLSFDLADNHKNFEVLLRSCIPVGAKLHFAFFSEKPVKLTTHNLTFSPKNMKLNGAFDSNELTHFFSCDYDLFLVCSNIENPFMNIILRNVQAGLTVSNQVNARRFSDLVVEVEPFNEQVFFTEFEKYIKHIRK